MKYKHAFIYFMLFVVIYSQSYLCCIGGTSKGYGSLIVSETECLQPYYDCVSWGNTNIDWSQIINTPNTLNGYGINNFPNR